MKKTKAQPKAQQTQQKPGITSTITALPVSLTDGGMVNNSNTINHNNNNPSAYPVPPFDIPARLQHSKRARQSKYYPNLDMGKLARLVHRDKSYISRILNGLHPRASMEIFSSLALHLQIPALTLYEYTRAVSQHIARF